MIVIKLLLVVFIAETTASSWYSRDSSYDDYHTNHKKNKGYYSKDKHNSIDKYSYSTSDDDVYYSSNIVYKQPKPTHDHNNHIDPTYFQMYPTDEKTLRKRNSGSSEYHRHHDHDHYHSDDHSYKNHHSHHNHDSYHYNRQGKHAKHAKHGKHSKRSKRGPEDSDLYHAVQNEGYADVYGAASVQNTGDVNSMYFIVIGVIAFLLLIGIVIALWWSSSKNKVPTKNGHIAVDNVDGEDEQTEIDIIGGWDKDNFYEGEEEEILHAETMN